MNCTRIDIVCVYSNMHELSLRYSGNKYRYNKDYKSKSTYAQRILPFNSIVQFEHISYELSVLMASAVSVKDTLLTRYPAQHCCTSGHSESLIYIE